MSGGAAVSALSASSSGWRRSGVRSLPCARAAPRSPLRRYCRGVRRWGSLGRTHVVYRSKLTWRKAVEVAAGFVSPGEVYVRTARCGVLGLDGNQLAVRQEVQVVRDAGMMAAGICAVSLMA